MDELRVKHRARRSRRASERDRRRIGKALPRTKRQLSKRARANDRTRASPVLTSKSKRNARRLVRNNTFAAEDSDDSDASSSSADECAPSSRPQTTIFELFPTTRRRSSITPQPDADDSDNAPEDDRDIDDDNPVDKSDNEEDNEVDARIPSTPRKAAHVPATPTPSPKTPDSSGTMAPIIVPINDKVQLDEAFASKLSLLSPQKKVPKIVGRDAVVNVLFEELFRRRRRNRTRRRSLSAQSVDEEYEDSLDEGAETDDEDLDEAWIKNGLANSIHAADMALPVDTPSGVLHRFVDVNLIHTLVRSLRFEDPRVPSPRFSILRALYRTMPALRISFSVALLSATYERYDEMRLRTTPVPQSLRSDGFVASGGDYASGLIDLLHFLLESLSDECQRAMAGGCTTAPSATTNGETTDDAPTDGETGEGDDDDGTVEDEGVVQRRMLRRKRREAHRHASQQQQAQERAKRHWDVLHNLVRTIVYLCKSHTFPVGHQQTEMLLDAVGQFVSHFPAAAPPLITQIIRTWPRGNGDLEVVFAQVVGRVLMAAPRLDVIDVNTQVHIRALRHLAKLTTKSHARTAVEGISFLGHDHAIQKYLVWFPELLRFVRESLLEAKNTHWSLPVRELADETFDKLLDWV